MASENIKIKIQEKDNTKPGGSGIAPSDIVFIPGFSNRADAPTNTPTLVEDYIQFEKLFGTTPAVLTTADVAGYEDYGYNAGDFDKSYIMAKEILFQGMPVVYSNLRADNILEAVENLQLYKPAKIDKGYKLEPSTLPVDVTLQDNSIVCSLKSEAKGTIFNGKATISTILSTNIDAMKENDPTCASFSFYTQVNMTNTDNNVSVSLAIDKERLESKDKNITIKMLSDSACEIYNNSVNEVTQDIPLTVTVNLNRFDKTDDETLNTLTIDIMKKTGSLLEAFYPIQSASAKPLIKEQLELISDKSVYSVKYITSGGYPSVVNSNVDVTLKFATEMLTAARTRGDAVAIIDYMYNPEDKPFATDSLPSELSFYEKVSSAFNGVADAEYGTMFYPWANYSCGSALSNVTKLESDDVYMPPSFAYMMCLAKAIKTSPNWLAMAGVTRGIVPKINVLCTPNDVLSNTDAEEMQPKFGVDGHKLSVNCITNIRPYGLTIWGNRTLKEVNKEGCVALNFLNIRNMLSDIKKVLYSTAKSLMFEQNSDTLWLKFKSGISPLLNQLKSGNGIEDYRIVRGTTKYNGDPLQKGEISAVIKIYPLYAVEYFELTVEINDNDVTVV